MNKLLLFDIDGTLIKESEAHKKSFSEAVSNVYGLYANINTVNYQGMTDRQIVIKLLEDHLDRKEIEAKLEVCLKEIGVVFDNLIESEEIIILDGAQELLEDLDDFDILLGLVTGNLGSVAKRKLEKVKINHYFSFGSFGDSAINRKELLKKATETAKKDFDIKLNNIFFLGDTPRDMEAGKSLGVKTIGIATGNYSKEELKKSDACFVLENLMNKEKLLGIIKNGGDALC